MDLAGALVNPKSAAMRLVVVLSAFGLRPASAQELALTRVRVDSVGTFAQLARAGYEVAGVVTVNGIDYALVVTSPAQRLALGAVGLEVRLAPLAAPRLAVPANFKDVTTIATVLDSLATANPRIVLDTIGFSFEGRPIHGVKIGEPDDAFERPNVLYVATHHAREWISTEFAMRLITYLADSLALTPNGAALLAARDVWVVPVLNPDGYQFSFEVERLWRKNRRPNGDGSVGVDLNRNYPGFWRYDDLGSSGQTAAETFRGAAPGSEPEVAALMAFHAAHPPAVAISYHSFTNLILHPYGFASGALAPDAPIFRALAGTPLAPAIRDGLLETARPAYHPGPGWQLYPTNGEYTEWAYRAHGTVAFTVELTAGCCVAGEWYGFEFPDDSAAIAQVVSDNLPFALAVLSAAGDLDRARDPAGNSPAGAFVESAWPEIRVIGPPGSATLPVVLRRAAGETMLALSADSLDRGTWRWRWRREAPDIGPDTEIEVPGLGLRLSILESAGAEDTLDGWTGWVRDSIRSREGRFAWAARNDTLWSPAFRLDDIDQPQLVFWTRHGGSLFQPARLGSVELSTDDGATWTVLSVVAGAATEWYPISLALPDGLEQLRVRFAAVEFPWWIDAVQLLGTRRAPPYVAPGGTITLSENPVRFGRLFFSWSPTAGEATLSVFTFASELVFRQTLDAQIGQLEWDLRNRNGNPVSNGAYVAVLQLPAETLRRRIFVARAQ